MESEIIRVEPLSTYLEQWKAPTSVAVRHGNTIYVSCTSVDFFPKVNAVYARYFKVPPARIVLNVPAWPSGSGRVDIEVDCIAARAHSNE